MLIGITVVPFVQDGKPFARVTLVGTTADSEAVIDAEGAEVAIQYDSVREEYHVVDYRGADAVSG